MFFKKLLSFMLLLCIFVSLTACEYDYSFTNSTIMCKVEKLNLEETSINENYWIGNYYLVYYDGTVEYYETYHLHGKINYNRWALTKKDLKEVQEILYNNTNTASDMSSCDGEVWNIKYYDTNENLISEYSGILDNHEYFEKLIKIIKPKT